MRWVQMHLVAACHLQCDRAPDWPPRPPCSCPSTQQVLEELERDRLDQWRWQSFVGEEAALECLYAEAPDTTCKRCLSKVGMQMRVGGVHGG